MAPPTLHPLLVDQLQDCAVIPELGTPLYNLLQKVSAVYAASDVSHEKELGIASKLLPMLQADVAGNITDWNPQLAQLTNVKADEVVDASLLDLVRSDARETARRMLAKALQGQVIHDVHLPIILPTGWQITLALGVSPHYDVRGRVIGMFALAQVTSPLAPASTEAKASAPAAPAVQQAALDAPTLMQIFHAANVPLICVDAQGQVALWNARIEALTSYSQHEVCFT